MKAVIAIDSYKGFLRSEQACRAAAAAFGPEDRVVAVPVSAGGEGFSGILTALLGGTFRTVEVRDPLGRPVRASYGIAPVPGFGKTAVVDVASAGGLTLLSPQERDPLKADSYGTGQLVADALAQGVDAVFLGLGGSATNDGGLGMLRALGAGPFSDGFGRGPWAEAAGKTAFHCFCDVATPFAGPDGASRVFAPQKGASPADVEVLEARMTELARVYGEQSGMDILRLPGAGAAGGIGGATAAFLGAQLHIGIAAFLELAGFGAKIQDADLVMTGEGRSDAQTLLGKTPLGVLQFVRKHGPASAKVALVSGAVTDAEALLAAGFDAVAAVTPAGVPLPVAMDPDYASRALTDCVRRLLPMFREGGFR